MESNTAGQETKTFENLDLYTWSNAVEAGFFPVQIVPDGLTSFVAHLRTWTFDGAFLASSRSSPARYSRPLKKQEGDDQHVTITFCHDVTIRLYDEQHERIYGPGQFMILRSNHPWNWEHETEGEMWSLRLPLALLKNRLGDIRRFEHYAYSMTKGSGRLLFDMVRLISTHVGEGSPSSLRGLRGALIEILAVALEEHDQVIGVFNSPTQRSHLSRIERYIHANIGTIDLTPRIIAESCNVSTRYLHEMFSAGGTSVSRWILEQRLQGAYRFLSMPRRSQSISQVALHWGFSDHSHFSRHFKVRFGHTPREAVAQAMRPFS